MRLVTPSPRHVRAYGPPRAAWALTLAGVVAGLLIASAVA